MLQRMWINQPSSLQPLHKDHGKLVLAIKLGKTPNSQVYFTSGDVISAIYPTIILSKGWPKHLQRN